MDFTKFVWMLEHQALYFSRADLLGDPFEGSYSKANGVLRPMVYKEVAEEHRTKMFAQMSALSRSLRLKTFVSCWHLNAGESAGMWRLYAKTNEAVAVRSSFRRLRDQLDPHTYIGLVKYIDFEKHWLPEGNTLYPYVHKRLSFAHEHEVRAVVQDLKTNKSSSDALFGIQKPIQHSDLIDAVFVAPTSPSWFAQLVQQVCIRYKLHVPVVQSSLDEKPFF